MAGNNNTYFSWIGTGKENRIYDAYMCSILNGSNNIASGDHATVLGGYNMIAYSGGCVFGQFNDDRKGANEGEEVLFALGNGGHLSVPTSKNALTVTKNGRIGGNGIRFPRGCIELSNDYIASIIMNQRTLAYDKVPGALETDGNYLYFTNLAGTRSPIVSNMPALPANDGRNYAIKDGMWNDIDRQLHPEVDSLFNIDPNMWLVRTSGGWGDIRGVYEPNLKIPAANNYVLISQTDGTRSWIDIQNLPHIHDYLIDAPVDGEMYGRLDNAWQRISDRFSERNHIHDYQPVDADLTSIANLTGMYGLLKKTAENTWEIDSNTYVNSFNGRTGVVTLEKADIESVLTGTITSHSHDNTAIPYTLTPLKVSRIVQGDPSIRTDCLSYVPDPQPTIWYGMEFVYNNSVGVSFRGADETGKLIGPCSFECIKRDSPTAGVEGRYSAAFGYNSTIVEGCECSFIGAGRNNRITSDYASTIGGYNLVASEDFQVVIGTFNKYGMNDGSAFVIGNGEIESLRSNAFEVKKDGRVIASSYVKVGDSSEVASINNVGAIRYRSNSNSSFAEMCMQTGVDTYEWVSLVMNTWV